MKSVKVHAGGGYRAKVGADVVPVKITDEAAIVVDRRTPRGAIPELERAAAAINAKIASRGSPKPPNAGAKAGKAKGGGSKSEKAAKTARAPKHKRGPKTKRISGLDAAAMVLAQARKPLNCAQMMEAIREKGLWKSGGKTPEATLYAAIIREIGAKGREARFKKVERGLFATTGKQG